MHQIHVSHTSALPVDALFAVLADHNQLSKVFGAPVKRIHAGASELNGVGSVRRIGFGGPLGVEETVTGLSANRSIAYKITKGGAPLKNHSGLLTFAAAGKGSQVEWTIDFDSSLPLAGHVVGFVLKQVIALGLKRVG